MWVRRTLWGLKCMLQMMREDKEVQSGRDSSRGTAMLPRVHQYVQPRPRGSAPMLYPHPVPPAGRPNGRCSIAHANKIAVPHRPTRLQRTHHHSIPHGRKGLIITQSFNHASHALSADICQLLRQRTYTQLYIQESRLEWWSDARGVSLRGDNFSSAAVAKRGVSRGVCVCWA